MPQGLQSSSREERGESHEGCHHQRRLRLRKRAEGRKEPERWRKGWNTLQTGGPRLDFLGGVTPGLQFQQGLEFQWGPASSIRGSTGGPLSPQMTAEPSRRGATQAVAPCFCSDLTEVFPEAIVQLICEALMGIK